MVNFVPNLSVRNKSNIGKTAHIISNFNNKGSALKNRLVTVLTDLRYSQNIRNIDNITAANVKNYTIQLQTRVHNKTLANKTSANYVSALNSILKYSDHPNLIISARQYGLSKGVHTPLDRSNALEIHQELLEHLQERFNKTGNSNYLALRQSVILQRELNLRMRESISLKASTIKQAIKTGTLDLDKHDGTKNGRSRSISLNAKQISVLRSAYDFQKTAGYKSLIDPNLTRNQYARWSYRQLNKFKAETGSRYIFHGNRHEKAHQLYSNLWQARTGIKINAPVVVNLKGSNWINYASKATGLPKEQVKNIDKEIRTSVSHELGHNRLEVTRDYLG